MKRLLIAILLLFAVPLQAQWRGSTVALRTELDSLRVITGKTGTVGLGVPAFLDSLGVIDTAYYDIPYLNRCLRGTGTGIEGKIFISGIVPANGVSEIGRKYYLENGVLISTMPTATNVWVAPWGKCVAAGYIRLNTSIIKQRMQ